jgi:hypothetical protein
MPKIPIARASKLKNLEVTKIALVPAGSNPKANVALFKSKKDATAPDVPIEPAEKPVKKATFDEIRGTRAAQNAIWKIYDACYDLQDAFYSTIYGDGDAGADIRKSVTQFSAHVDNILDELASGSYEKADPNAIRKAVLDKMAEFASRIAPEEDDVKKTIKKVAPAAPAKPVAKEKALEELSKEELIERVKKAEAPKPVEKAEDDEDDEEDDEEEVAELDDTVKKALPPEVVALITKLSKTANTALATAASATTLAKQEAEKREKAEYIQRARTELKHLPGTAEENGAMLMNLYKTLPKEQADAVVKSLQAGDAAIGMLGEETGADNAVTGSALEQLNTLAKELQKTDPKLTFAKAFTKVCDQNIEVYKQHRLEQKSRSFAE